MTSSATTSTCLLGREQVLKELRRLGVQIVELDRADFKGLAANAVSPEPGKLLFSAPVSDALRQRLAEHGIESTVPAQTLGYLDETDAGFSLFGVHCLTLELPLPGKGPRLREEL